MDVIDAVVARVGAEKTAIRFSPWSVFQDMRMADPVPTFSYVLEEIRKRHPNFAYVHFIEGDASKGESLDFARKIWHSGRPLGEEGVFLSCGEHTPESAFKHAEEYGDVVVFGRTFTSNPDLVRRIRENIPLAPVDANVFYNKMEARGYVDYPFAEQKVSAAEIVESAVEEVAHL